MVEIDRDDRRKKKNRAPVKPLTVQIKNWLSTVTPIEALLYITLLIFALASLSEIKTWNKTNASISSTTDAQKDPDEISTSGLSLLDTIIVPEKPTVALQYSALVFPMEEGEVNHHNVLHCPNRDGGGKNKFCSKGYAEYTFKVMPDVKYYLYIETIAPTIYDNSLWVGVGEDASEDTLQRCPRLQAGPLVPVSNPLYLHKSSNVF